MARQLLRIAEHNLLAAPGGVTLLGSPVDRWPGARYGRSAGGITLLGSPVDLVAEQPPSPAS